MPVPCHHVACSLAYPQPQAFPGLCPYLQHNVLASIALQKPPQGGHPPIPTYTVASHKSFCQVQPPGANLPHNYCLAVTDRFLRLAAAAAAVLNSGHRWIPSPAASQTKPNQTSRPLFQFTIFTFIFAPGRKYSIPTFTYILYQLLNLTKSILPFPPQYRNGRAPIGM